MLATRCWSSMCNTISCPAAAWRCLTAISRSAAQPVSRAIRRTRPADLCVARLASRQSLLVPRAGRAVAAALRGGHPWCGIRRQPCLPPDAVVISKDDTRANADSLFRFRRHRVRSALRRADVRRMFVGGLATDYCVLNTVRDAWRWAMSSSLLTDAVRPVDVHPGDGERALAEMRQAGRAICRLGGPDAMNSETRLLLTDLYQLTMLQAYFEPRHERYRGVRVLRAQAAARAQLPDGGRAGAGARVSRTGCASRRGTGLAARQRALSPAISSISSRSLRFTGDVDAMPEGTVFFADEPILRVIAPLPQAQLVETRLINLLHFQTAGRLQGGALGAGGARQAAGRFRPAPRARRGGGLLAARASYLAGFAGTSTVLAGTRVRHPDLRHHGAFLRAGA